MKILIKSLLALYAASALLILMGAAFLYGWAIPNLDSLRPRAETYLSDHIGHPVKIDSIKATTTGWLPSFDIRGIHVLDAKGQLALTLGRVQAELSASSLLTLGVDRLSLEALHIEISRDAQGQLTVAGFALSPSDTPGKAMDWLFSQKEVVLSGSTVHWADAQPHLIHTSEALPEATFNNVSLKLRNGLRSHDIYFEATPPESFGQSFRVTGKFMQPMLEPHAGRWQAWTGHVSGQIVNTPTVAKKISAQLSLPDKKMTVSGEHIQVAALPKLAKWWDQALPINANDSAALQANSGVIERFKLLLPDASQPLAQVSLQANLVSPDAVGDVDVTWTAKDGIVANGNIDAKGQASHIHVALIQPYLPENWKPVFQKGIAKELTFSVKGALKHFPFVDDKLGQLRVAGKLMEGQFVFGDFPALKQSSATFQLNNQTLRFDDVNTVIANLPTKGSVEIADLRAPAVHIEAQAKGDIPDWLEFFNSAPLKSMTNNAFADIRGTGAISTQFQVRLPLYDRPQSKVSGTVQFLNNEIAPDPAIPSLTNVVGKINFGKKTGLDFQIQDLQANWLGGVVQVAGDNLRMTGQGTLTAEAIQAWRSIPFIKGTAPYQFELDLQGQGGLIVESSLVGLQLDLPAPFAKATAESWPLRFAQTKSSQTQDHLMLRVADKVSTEFIRRLNPNKKDAAAVVTRGNVSVGKEMSSLLPEQGVSAQIQLTQLNIDVWREFVAQLPAQSTATQAFDSYLPTQIAVQLDSLKIADRQFDHIVLGASKLGKIWRMNADAKDFNGYAEYRPTRDSEAGQFYARLQRLTLRDADSKSQIEKLLAQAAPSSLPALDIVVEDFELIGKKMGRLEVSATNQVAKGFLGTGQTQEWRLQKLNMINPESELKATGVWTPTSDTKARSVDLQFNLEVADSGELLARFGQVGMMRGGKGNMQGRIAWVGSPLALDYPTLTGQVKLDISKGQFLKIDPGSAGRLMNVLSLQALPKLLTLNFKDIFSDGFIFDSLSGDAQITQGIARSTNLQMKSPLALVSLDGAVDLARETQNLHVLVLPDIDAGGVSVLATLVNPVVGAAAYLAQLILKRPVNAAVTQAFNIDGSWHSPNIVAVKRK